MTSINARPRHNRIGYGAMSEQPADESVMRQAENYWVPRDDNMYARYTIPVLAPRNPDAREVLNAWGVKGWGTPAVRYRHEIDGAMRQIMMVFGGLHSSAPEVRSPVVWMDLDTAEELVEMLQAAIIDGRRANGAPDESIPFRDITLEPCRCNVCGDSARR
ncbi:hypothetical protein [Nocardia sp. NPDC050406]|uniref:hypothetical protein n=1 Tax=Nocardia sp. NPDC050406 TaxID=3364318 RepID=UPI00378BA1F8